MAYPKGKPKSAESKAKTSASCRAAWTDEKRAARSAQYLGENNPFFGRSHSSETRERLSVANTGRMLTDEHKRKVSESLKGNQRALGHHYSLTPEQRQAIADRQRGPTGSGWRGGITPEHQRIRASAPYAAWRTEVFERDDYTCTECGQRGGSLQAHHVLAFSDYPDLRLDVGNGETLCVGCHKAVHVWALDRIAA